MLKEGHICYASSTFKLLANRKIQGPRLVSFAHAFQLLKRNIRLASHAALSGSDEGMTVIRQLTYYNVETAAKQPIIVACLMFRASNIVKLLGVLLHPRQQKQYEARFSEL